MIAAGRLIHRVRIATPTIGEPDDRGSRAVTWTQTLATVWACIEPLTSRTQELAKAFTPTVTHTITIRYLSTVTSRHRVEMGSRVFAINGVINAREENEDTVLYCTEVIE